MSNDLQRLNDERALYKLACLYARGADRADPEIWRAIMTDDMVLILPTRRLDGLERVLQAPPALRQKYFATQHRVLNQIYEISGDAAEGETYCVADHVSDTPEEGRMLWSLAIRYQDQCRRIGGVWRFAQRELIVDWSERRPLGPAN